MSDPYKPWGCYVIAPWHRWFAWRPVDTEDYGWVWLRTVNRRRCGTKMILPGPMERFFQYAVDV